MTIRKEQEHLLQQANLRQLKRGAIDRREFLTRTVAAGLGMAGVGVAAQVRHRDRPSRRTAR